MMTSNGPRPSMPMRSQVGQEDGATAAPAELIGANFDAFTTLLNVSNARALPSYQATATSGVGADVSGMPFLLDLVETGEQWVVTCTNPHGKAASPIPVPVRPDVLHSPRADIEKALIRSCRLVATLRAAPVGQAIREAACANTAGVHTTYRPPANEAPDKQTLYVPPAGSMRRLRHLEKGCWGPAR
jgi:hypothetical protein